MNCAEGSSREQWTQFAFRGGSTKRNKLADYLRSDEVYQMVLKNRIVNSNTKELFKTIPDI